MQTALATIPWQTFTQEYWQVEPMRLEYAPRGEGGPMLCAVAYADGKCRLLLPPYQPYIPLEFKPTPTEASYRIQRQWLETARLLVDDMLVHGLRGSLTFSPAVTDPRPWIWSHFRVSQWFTNFIDFPFTLDQADRVVRQQANKAVRAGFLCQRTDNLDDALHCLTGSEKRKGFSYGISLQGLELANRLLGPEALRVYICYAAGGEPAAARVVLHRPGGRACDWIAGTGDRYLHAGVTQRLMCYMFEDLQQAGASGYDSCGAGDETVALAKTAWGGRLMTEYSIDDYNLRSIKHRLGDMLRYLKRQKSVRGSRRAGGPADAPSAGCPAAMVP